MLPKLFPFIVAAPLIVLAAFLAFAPGLPVPGAGAGATVEVNTTDGDNDGTCQPLPGGDCTVWEAINIANTTTDALIRFNIPGCPPTCTISPTSELPQITAAGTVIDGTTQPGYAGTPIVIIDGALTEFAHGLLAFADNVVIRGVVVQNFDAMGVNADFTAHDGRRVESSIIRDNGTYGVGFTGNDAAVIDSTIEGNGDAGIGAAFAGAGTGLLVDGNEITGNGGYGVAYSFIDTTITDNLISGNGFGGTQSAGGSGGTTVVTGNVVSDNGEGGIFASEDTLDISGNTVTGNGLTGIFAGGGPGTVTNNTVSGNGFAAAGQGDDPAPGVELGGEGGKIVTGNEIANNAGEGIAVFNSGNTIGGTSGQDANLISGNGSSGVWIVRDTSILNSVRGNSIHDNGGLGIDLGDPDEPNGVTPNDPMDTDDGANALQNFPTLTAAVSGSLGVEGTLNSTPTRDFVIELFANAECDPSGAGEGETYLGSVEVTTDAVGDTDFSFHTVVGVSQGQFITATATDTATGNTSEFSECVEVAVPATPPPTPSPTPTLTPTATPTPTPTVTPTPTPTPTPTASPTGTSNGLTQGDVDCNSDVSSVDALKELRFVAALAYSQNQPCPLIGEDVASLWGDVDCNGQVTSVDALKVLRHVASLPVSQTEPCPDIGTTAS